MELKQELKYSEDPAFKEFKNLFVQRIPRYTVKLPGRPWKTKQKALSDTPIISHLEGKYYIGTLGKWYPGFCVFDFDDVSMDDIERIRDSVRLEASNSMLINSESPGSYHLYFPTLYNGKPPTVRAQQAILKPFAQQNNIEIYPQPNRTLRLPFGAGQDCVDIEYLHLKDWKQKLRWFNKLDPLDLKTVPYHQQELDLYIPAKRQPGAYKTGKQLLETGLDSRNSRHEAQFNILCYLHAINTTPEAAIETVYNWVKNKHNGYSKEVNSGHLRSIKDEIIRQAHSTYSTNEHSYYYPNEINNSHNGYITKADIKDIIMLTGASMPRVKFLYNLVKYCYPRRYRNFVDIHSDRFIEWGSRRNYLQYLEEFKGILNRGETYQAADRSKNIKGFSKSIKLTWNYRDISQAILIDDRAPETFEDTIRLTYQPQEFRELLTAAGAKRTAAIDAVKRTYEVSEMSKHNKL